MHTHITYFVIKYPKLTDSFLSACPWNRGRGSSCTSFPHPDTICSSFATETIAVTYSYDKKTNNFLIYTVSLLAEGALFCNRAVSASSKFYCCLKKFKVITCHFGLYEYITSLHYTSKKNGEKQCQPRMDFETLPFCKSSLYRIHSDPAAHIQCFVESSTAALRKYSKIVEFIKIKQKFVKNEVNLLSFSRMCLKGSEPKRISR